MTKSKIEFPHIYLERKITSPRHWKFLGPLLALLTTFGITTIFILVSKANPLVAFSSLFSGFFGNSFSISETLVGGIPLIFMGISTVVAFKSGFWNIGLEGQLYAGALFATWTALSLSASFSMVALPLALLFSFVGGALWVAIPAVLKIKFGVSEVLTTLMFNYIMIYVVNYVLFGPWQDPIQLWPVSPIVPSYTYLPRLGLYRLHFGLIIALICVVFAYLLFKHTTLGFKLRSVGENQRASYAAGINVKKCILIAALLSGGLAGIVGANEVLGIHYRMRLNLSPGYGWTGIAVGLLAKLNPLGVLITAVFLGGLMNGGTAMQQTVDIPYAITDIMQGLIIISVLAFELVGNYRIRVIWGEK